MNRAILLVITDFLLLSMLALARFDEPAAEAPPPPDPAEMVRDVTTEEAELIEVLRLSLEAEQAERLALGEDLSATRENLEETRDRLEDREARLEETSETLAAREAALEKRRRELESTRGALESVEAEKAAIEAETKKLAEQRERELAAAARERAAIEAEAKERAAEAAVIQERLRAIQEQLERRERDLQAEREERRRLAEEKERIERERREIATALEVTSAQKALLSENLEDARGELDVVRSEKQALREQAEKLSENVGELAEASGAIKEELKEEIQRAQPKTASTIYTQYRNNTLEARFRTTTEGMFGSTSTRVTSSPTTLVSDGSRVYAILHARDTPFSVQRSGGKVVSVEGQLILGETVAAVEEIGILRADPRILIMPVPRTWVEEKGLEPFRLSPEPFRFDRAVLIDADENYYGESAFQVDANHARYLEVDRRIFSRLFGEFAPSRGDLVFAKTGNLVGMMVNDRRAVLLDDLNREYRFALHERFPVEESAAVMDALRERMGGYPSKLR